MFTLRHKFSFLFEDLHVIQPIFTLEDKQGGERFVLSSFWFVAEANTNQVTSGGLVQVVHMEVADVRRMV